MYIVDRCSPVVWEPMHRMSCRGRLLIISVPHEGALHMKTCPHEGAPAPHEVAFYLVQSTINSHELCVELPRQGREEASRRPCGEADGGMQHDAGSIGRRLTKVEDAIDTAVLELAYDRHRVGRDVGTAASAAVSEQWPRAAGARPWSQLVVVAWAVGAVWIQ